MQRNAQHAKVAYAGWRDRPASDPLPGDRLDGLESLATTMRYRRGQEIYAPDDPAEYWYRIVWGTARKCAVRSDGRRQIVDFLLQGDFFGLVNEYKHHFAVEAITEGTVVAKYPRRRVESFVDSDPQVGRRIREVAFGAIARSQARLVILGRMSALERVGAFLIEMAERTCAEAPGRVVLSMSRYDIGDYLGLAAETVSRTLSELEQAGAIRFEGRHRVRIVDRIAVEGRTGNSDWDPTGHSQPPPDPFSTPPVRGGQWGFRERRVTPRDAAPG
jgi:CRP/FNR family transcriptional regulator, nitrogen fixation regulation protein